MKGEIDMFTLNDLLNQVECQGKVRIMVIEDNGDLRQVYKGDNINNCLIEYKEKELAYIWSDRDVTVYEVNE